jgi:uncharacterized membrane protein YfcA
MIETLLLLTGGLTAGALGGFLGIGGGIVLMPLLRFLVGLSPAQAAGTCILAVLFTSVGGSFRHLRQGHLQLGSIVPVIVSGAVASGLCSFAFGYLARRGHWLDLGIGLVFLFVSSRMIVVGWRGAAAKGTEQETANNVIRGPLALKVAIGAAAGGLPGLLGIGTGGILVPAFTFLLGASVKTAMAASLTCYTFTAAISAAFKLAQGYVALGTALPLCLGTLIGANLGAMINRRSRSGVLQLAFGIVFVFVSLRFFAAFFFTE